MPAQLGVGARPAPVLDQEQPQVLLGRAQILRRVHRPQYGILGDALVEPVDQAGEGLLPAHRLVEAGRLAHARKLTEQSHPDRPRQAPPRPLEPRQEAPRPTEPTPRSGTQPTEPTPRSGTVPTELTPRSGTVP